MAEIEITEEAMLRTLKSEEYTRKYYTEWCRTHEDFIKANVPSGYSRVMAYLEPKMNEKILDIGCGRGEIVKQCSIKGAFVVGIDYSEAAVQIAKENGNQNILRASAAALPFPSSSFDKICFMEILEHLDDSDLEACIQEIKRILKPGGYLVGSTPNAWGNLLVWLTKLLRPIGINVTLATREDPTHINVKNPVQVFRLFTQAGFLTKLRLGEEYQLYSFRIPLWKRVAAKFLFFTLHTWWTAAKPKP